jgi:hypothetical protein
LPKDGITSKIFEWKVDKAVLKEKKENEVVNNYYEANSHNYSMANLVIKGMANN